LGLAYSKLGDYKEAVKVFYRAKSLNPSNPIYNYHLGIALSNLNRYVEAIFMLRFFIVLANKEKYENLIKDAEERIKKLKSERKKLLKGK
ncbi:MAG: tetratricopeptide repeat protein, partial [Candidatus Aenigmatarchaeota archaeon]